MRDGLVMLGGLGESTRIVYGHLARELGLRRAIIETPIPRSQLLKRRAEKLGAPRAFSQAAFAAIVVPALRRISRDRIAELRRRIEPTPQDIPEDVIIRVPSANSRECIAALRELQPRVVVVNGTRILHADVLTAMPATFINMHAGLTPRYRGVHGAYWARAEGRSEAAGVTVHLVDKGIDTGQILGQAAVHPEPHDTFVTLPYLQLEAGIPILIRVVGEALAGRAKPVPSLFDLDSRLWYHPTVGEYVRNFLRHGAK